MIQEGIFICLEYHWGDVKKYTLDLFYQVLAKEIKIIYYSLISKQKTEKSDFPAFLIR